MRVITGRFKGRQLAAPPDRSIRPATDRVKQALFDALSTRIDMEEISVLDLYAGTGSLGIECLSRGAQHCTFVDSSPDAITCIEGNLESLGCSAMARVVQSDAMRFLASCHDRFRLIFADPPYSYPLTATIPEAISSREILLAPGFLLIEHSKSLTFGESGGFPRAIVKKFGSTHVSFFVHTVT